MNLHTQAKVSKKAVVEVNKKFPSAQVRGMPLLLEFPSNLVSVNFELVSAELEVPNEFGSIVFNKFPVAITIGLSLDPAKQQIVTQIQSLDFELENHQYVVPSLKEKPELTLCLDSLKELVKKELIKQIKEKFVVT